MTAGSGNIAAARHMTTTAQGVETERQQELLRGLVVRF
jgi:EAL domain-containing protein (putative c-di-GMP-specific phosphodiesterase class I)